MNPSPHRPEPFGHWSPPRGAAPGGLPAATPGQVPRGPVPLDRSDQQGPAAIPGIEVAKPPIPGPGAASRLEPDLRAILGRLTPRLSEYLEAGGSLTGTQLAERLAAAIPQPSPWNELIGPFYATAQVRKLLGVTRQAVDDRLRRRTMLALKTADNRWVYPIFQFDERNQLLPGLAEVLACFDPATVDDWTVAGWIASSHEALGGDSVLERLRRGGDIDDVLTLARDAARRFAQ